MGEFDGSAVSRRRAIALVWADVPSSASHQNLDAGAQVAGCARFKRDQREKFEQKTGFARSSSRATRMVDQKISKLSAGVLVCVEFPRPCYGILYGSRLTFGFFAGMGIFVLVSRLCQTSMMVLCQRQMVQASFATIITLVAIIVQRELWPYRRDSE